VCWTSVGKREADAGHACPAETLPGGDKRTSCGALSPLAWVAGVSLPADTDRTVSDVLKC